MQSPIGQAAQDEGASKDSRPVQVQDAPSSDADETADSRASRLFTRLGRLWKDDHLRLREGLWPVPTRLARLAAKRAMLHIRNDDAKQQEIIKKVQTSFGEDLTQILAEAVTLPKLGDALGKTLYYL